MIPGTSGCSAAEVVKPTDSLPTCPLRGLLHLRRGAGYACQDRIGLAPAASGRPTVSSTPRALRMNRGDAELGLQRPDLLAERRLLHAKPLRGAGDVPFLGDGEEVAEMTQFHGVIISEKYGMGRFQHI